MARREILIASNDQEVSENRLRQALGDTVFNVEEAYGNLVYSREFLEVQRESLKLARELAEKKLAAEEQKLEAGLTTNYIVLQHQRDLALAKTNETRARVD